MKKDEKNKERINAAPNASKPLTFKQKREEFFARREGLFLWLLAPPVLIAGLILLVIVLLWLARQVGILSGAIEPSSWF